MVPLSALPLMSAVVVPDPSGKGHAPATFAGRMSPNLHEPPLGTTFPHPPQLLVSVWKSAQAPEQQTLPEHWFFGSVAAVTLAQVPLAPPVMAAKHAVQVPVHAVSQHTPSTQKPDVH
jgi:hypothetical protein